MINDLERRARRLIAAALAISLAWPAGAAAAPATSPISARQSRLARFLRTYAARQGVDGASTRYMAAFADLKADGGAEAIVYLQGDGWCGSGGCTLLVLAPRGASFRLAGEISVTRAPIRLLASRSHGWRDIGVMVSGGGVQPGYEAALSFDGARYPDNPTTPPARPLRHLAGKVVIAAGAVGQPL